MKKKSLLTMVMALTLVGAVGIGATLAYLSSTTEVMTNTFSVGKVKVTQDEAVWNDATDTATDDRTSTGNSYTDIQPGDTMAKDPTATVLANSSDCYVFMQLSGADDLVANNFSFEGFDSSKWVKVADADGDADTALDGVYRYTSVVSKSDANQKLPALFNSVTYSIEAEELAPNVSLSNVVIKTCAVQADHMTTDTALAAAVTELTK